MEANKIDSFIKQASSSLGFKAEIPTYDFNILKAWIQSQRFTYKEGIEAIKLAINGQITIEGFRLSPILLQKILIQYRAKKQNPGMKLEKKITEIPMEEELKTALRIYNSYGTVYNINRKYHYIIKNNLVNLTDSEINTLKEKAQTALKTKQPAPANKIGDILINIRAVKIEPTKADIIQEYKKQVIIKYFKSL